MSQVKKTGVEIDRNFLIIRLEFLFQLTWAMNSAEYGNEETVTKNLTTINSEGLGIILQRLMPGQFDSNSLGIQYCGEICELVEGHFNRMLKQLYVLNNNRSGLPITLIVSKKELLVIAGIEVLADEIIKLLNSIENYPHNPLP